MENQMTGPRQHHIPQALQKGFSTPAGKRSNVWLYRKGKDGPVNTNIKNVGLEIDFYVDGADDSLDRELTRLENEYGRVLSSIRQGRDPAQPDLDVLKRLLANCMVRTDRVRFVLAEGRCAVGQFLRSLGDDTDMLRQGMEGAYADEEHLMAHLHQSIRDMGKPVPSDRVLLPLLQSQVAKARKSLDRDMPLLTGIAKHRFGEAAVAAMSSDPQSEHLAAIRQAGPEPAARREQIEAKPFGVAKTVDGGLVLGDCVVVGVDHEGRLVDAMYPSGELRGLIMPLTPSVFAYSGHASLASTHPRDINDASIGLSYQFFIAKERIGGLAQRLVEIGSRPNVVEQLPWEEVRSRLKQQAEAGTLHKSSGQVPSAES